MSEDIQASIWSCYWFVEVFFKKLQEVVLGAQSIPSEDFCATEPRKQVCSSIVHICVNILGRFKCLLKLSSFK